MKVQILCSFTKLSLDHSIGRDNLVDNLGVQVCHQRKDATLMGFLSYSSPTLNPPFNPELGIYTQTLVGQ